MDQFFKNITHLGDGVTVAILGIVFLLLQVRKGIVFILSGALAGMITQFFKRVVFNEHYRPTKFFKLNFPDLELPLVAGVEMHSNFSFPSGHTTAAFAMMTAAALLTKNKWADIVFIVAGVVISFSRVYLSQHFLEDVFVGSIVGTIVTIIIYQIFHSDKLLSVAWMNKKILPSKNGKK